MSFHQQMNYIGQYYSLPIKFEDPCFETIKIAVTYDLYGRIYNIYPLEYHYGYCSLLHILIGNYRFILNFFRNA